MSMGINNTTGTGKTWEPLPKNKVKGDLSIKIQDIIKSDPKLFNKTLNDLIKKFEEKGKFNAAKELERVIDEITKNNQPEKIKRLPENVKEIIIKKLEEDKK